MNHFTEDTLYDPGGAMNSTLIRVHHDGYDLSEGGDSGGPWFSLNTAYGLHFGGISFDAYYMAINYIDILGLSVFTIEVALPIVLKGQTPFMKIGSLEFINPYPSQSDEGISIKSPSTPEPYPYP